MSDSFGRGRIQDLARQLAGNLTSKFQEKQAQAEATITSVTRDAAGRATGATAIVDGVAAQAVAIDHGARIAPGDVWQVRNQAGAALPRWVAERRLKAAAEVQAPDALPTLPTPAGLAVDSDVYHSLAPGAGWRAYLRSSWLGIGPQYGTMGYEVQYCTNDLATVTTVTVTDRHPTTLLDGAIDDSQVVIPRDPDVPGYQDDFPTFGRIQIESEKVDYTAVTTGAGDSGAAGTGDAGMLTDAGKAWTPDEWAGYALTDSAGDVFLVESNTATVLTVAGTPASGAYIIKPCFSGCTRGAGGTTPATHDDDTGVGALSVGVTLAELQPATDYNVRVRAKSAGGAISAWTAWVSVQTEADELPPATPTGMRYLALGPMVIELAWDMGTDGDLSHYVIDVSRAPDPWESVGGYPRTIRATSHRIGWGWVFPCYWRIKAVDWNGNMSAWCDIQIALAAWPEAPGIPNPGFEDGVGAPEHWTLTTAGRVTASWGTDTNPKTGASTRTGKLAVTAGSGGGDVDALVSGIFEINRFQSYGLGCSVLRKTAVDNVYHFVVLQYQDAGGTPASTPRRELGDVGFVGVDAWAFQSDDFTVWPDDDDVSHIAVAIVVDHATTYNQEVHFDDFKCILREWVQFPEESGPVDDDLSNYVHVSLAKTITAQHSFSPAAAQAPFVLGANAQGQVVEGLVADRLNVVYGSEEPASPAAGMLWLLAAT